jgi:hypothetical protein
MTAYTQTTYKVGASQNKAFTASAANADPVDSDTKVVRLVADQDCHVAFTGDATTASMKLVSGVPEYFSIDGGDVISVIRTSADGTLNITEMVS